jgi:hypothetical protein
MKEREKDKRMQRDSPKPKHWGRKTLKKQE